MHSNCFSQFHIVFFLGHSKVVPLADMAKPTLLPICPYHVLRAAANCNTPLVSNVILTFLDTYFLLYIC